MNTTKDPLGLIYEQRICEMSYGLSPTAQPITAAEIVQKIQEAEKTGATPVSITAVTTPQQRKTGNDHLPIMKVSRMNGMINADYEKSVNRQREREGLEADFTRGAGWGEHISTAIVQGKNGLSLAIQPNPNNPPPSSVYVGTGTGIPTVITSEPGEFINPPYTGNSQGVAKKIPYRRVLISNIAGIVIGKTEYIVTDLSATQKEVLEVSGLKQ